ncbi:hypothetical protein Q5H92_08905 [Hymenobacter sp. M29]|uniref:Tail terminator n=1 Tax=Hymenobacter mellowenesis TaxID=3063995 RepID=A0ABT9A9F4_9BACT|nr:hypothetical protein [Hymenobacter sp. M29]MDO7846474.1 hypothetical protein [Hymenobacter sp. M29]
MQKSFDEVLNYLQGLGRRRTAISRAALGYEGSGQYPVLVVEPDPFCGESSPGLMNYDFAFLVLNREADENGVYQRRDPAQEPALLAQTGQWCDELIEMLRHENPGDLAKGTYNRAALTQHGTDLATGWRVEFRLQVAQNIDRRANADLFAPAE